MELRECWQKLSGADRELVGHIIQGLSTYGENQAHAEYRAEIGRMTPTIKAKIDKLVNDYGMEEVLEAIRTTSEKGGHSIAYIEKCLANTKEQSHIMSYQEAYDSLYGEQSIESVAEQARTIYEQWNTSKPQQLNEEELAEQRAKAERERIEQAEQDFHEALEVWSAYEYMDNHLGEDMNEAVYQIIRRNNRPLKEPTREDFGLTIEH